MSEKMHWAANTKRSEMAYAYLHLAVIPTGEVVLMDDQGRVIAGTRSIEVKCEVQSSVSVKVEMLVAQPPVETVSQ